MSVALGTPRARSSRCSTRGSPSTRLTSTSSAASQTFFRSFSTTSLKLKTYKKTKPRSKGSLIRSFSWRIPTERCWTRRRLCRESLSARKTPTWTSQSLFGKPFIGPLPPLMSWWSRWSHTKRANRRKVIGSTGLRTKSAVITRRRRRWSARLPSTTTRKSSRWRWLTPMRPSRSIDCAKISVKARGSQKLKTTSTYSSRRPTSTSTKRWIEKPCQSKSRLISLRWKQMHRILKPLTKASNRISWVA